MNLKVISFNIRCTDDPDGHSIIERAPRLYEATAAYDADVIGFQEYRPGWEEHIEKYYLDKYEIFNKYRNNDVDIESAPILWKKDKFECIDKGYFWLSDTPEVESRGWDTWNCYRICLYVILREKNSGKEFTFMNTHFGFGDEGQIASANLLYDYRKKISSNPTFITGDFNMKPDAPAYATMTENFVDVNMATAKDMRATYHGYNPEKNPNEHIDYCFADGCIKPAFCKMIDTTFDGKYPSDHFGLYIELDI